MLVGWALQRWKKQDRFHSNSRVPVGKGIESFLAENFNSVTDKLMDRQSDVYATKKNLERKKLVGWQRKIQIGWSFGLFKTDSIKKIRDYSFKTKKKLLFKISDVKFVTENCRNPIMTKSSF